MAQMLLYQYHYYSTKGLSLVSEKQCYSDVIQGVSGRKYKCDKPEFYLNFLKTVRCVTVAKVNEERDHCEGYTGHVTLAKVKLVA